MSHACKPRQEWIDREELLKRSDKASASTTEIAKQKELLD